ncbi:MAG: restriction endonuclease subunit S, partial [Candidatus Cloacimonetes bacterium]|nr:restriction endonuclease subunit S [Candidatus Cloacimonadota bacterium]
EVPEHWGYCALGRVCRIQGGYAFDSSNFSDEGFPLVQMSNLKRGCLDLTDSKKYPEELCPREVELDEGDILLGMSGSIGDTGSLGNYAMVKKTDLPCYLNQRVGKLDVSSKLYRGFVYYLIQSTPFFEQVQLSVTGTAQFNISPSQLSDIWIALPPATEQNDISNYLDKKTSKMETIIGRVENSITLLREYRASLIHHAVTGKIDLRGHDAQAQ